MRSIQARFNKVSEKNPYWSSLVSFQEAVRGQKFSKDTINRWFHRLVEKGDYPKNITKDVLRNVYFANKDAQENQSI